MGIATATGCCRLSRWMRRRQDSVSTCSGNLLYSIRMSIFKSLEKSMYQVASHIWYVLYREMPELSCTWPLCSPINTTAVHAFSALLIILCYNCCTLCGEVSRPIVEQFVTSHKTTTVKSWRGRLLCLAATSTKRYTMFLSTAVI